MSDCPSNDLCHTNVELPESARYLRGFVTRGFQVAKMALFKSYVVFYVTIGAAIYDVLPVFLSYPHDDTEMSIFVLTICCDQSEPHTYQPLIY